MQDIHIRFIIKSLIGRIFLRCLSFSHIKATKTDVVLRLAQIVVRDSLCMNLIRNLTGFIKGRKKYAVMVCIRSNELKNPIPTFASVNSRWTYLRTYIMFLIFFFDWTNTQLIDNKYYKRNILSQNLNKSLWWFLVN